MHVSYVLSINKDNSSDESFLQYYQNHPPWTEDYKNPIPVSVVYEDDTITEKTIKPEVEENPTEKPDLHFEKNNPINEASEEITTQRIDVNTALKKSVEDNDDKQEDIPVRSKARTLSDRQIPVAVVYDSTPSNIQSANTFKINIPRRRQLKQVRRRKQHGTSIANEKPLAQSTESAKFQIETVDDLKSQTKIIESARPEARTTGFAETELGSVQSIVQQNTKALPRKRLRNPVVPIINSENYVFSHSGNFHYRYIGFFTKPFVNCNFYNAVLKGRFFFSATKGVMVQRHIQKVN